MLNSIRIIIAFLSFNAGFAQSTDTFYSYADVFFKEYVSNGKVNYAAIKNNPDKLDEILNMAESISIEKTDANNYQAFWINAYNLSVIKGIIDNYPIKSPLSKAGFFDKITYKLGGKSITLNDIENKLLRAQFNDPRFHFVLVCGAISCPPLISEAYLPTTLEAQLLHQTKLAINGDYFIQVTEKGVRGSEILKWYKEDFTMNGTSEIDFINTYRTEKIPDKSKLRYSTYNWSLNDQ